MKSQTTVKTRSNESNSPNKTHDLDQLNGKSGGLEQGWWFEIRIEFNLLSDSLPGYFQGSKRNPNQPGPKPPLVDLMINGLKTWSFHLQVFMCERSVPDENEPQKNGDSETGGIGVSPPLLYWEFSV